MSQQSFSISSIPVAAAPSPKASVVLDKQQFAHAVSSLASRLFHVLSRDSINCPLDQSVAAQQKAGEFRNDPEDLCAFVHSLALKATLSQSTFILALYYITKLKHLNPHLRINRVNICRLYLISLQTAAKFLEDESFVNADWVVISGSFLTAQKLKSMEVEFLSLLQHSLWVTWPQLQSFVQLLCEESDASTAASVACASSSSPVIPTAQPLSPVSASPMRFVIPATSQA